MARLEHPLSHGRRAARISRANRRSGPADLECIHGCPFCRGEDIYETIAGEPNWLLGMSEAWLPSTSSEVIYLAPSLVHHYIGTHRYLPPDVMIADVMQLPLDPAQWDTPKGAYRQLCRRYGE